MIKLIEQIRKEQIGKGKKCSFPKASSILARRIS